MSKKGLDPDMHYAAAGDSKTAESPHGINWQMSGWINNAVGTQADDALCAAATRPWRGHRLTH